MHYQVFFSAITSLIFFSFFLWIHFKAKKSEEIRMFKFMTLSLAFWSISSFFFFSSSSYSFGMLWSKMIYFFGSLIPPTFFLFSFTFPQNKFTISAKQRLFVFIPNFLLFYLIFINQQIVLGVKTVDGYKGFVYGPAFILWNVHFFSIFTLFFWRLIRIYLKEKGVNKLRVQHFTVGTAIGFVLAGVSSVVLPIVDNFSYVFLGPVLTVPWLIFVCYAIFKYQFMGIRVIIHRSLVYSVLISIITVVMFITLYIAEHLLQNIVGYGSFLTSVVAATTLAITFIPLYTAVQKFINKLFLHKTPFELEQENTLLMNEVSEKEKFKAVSTLASGIAHEIKNPLTTIKTFADHLPTKLDDKEFLKKFSYLISKEVDRMDDLIHQLMNHAKPSPPKFEPVNVRKLIQDTLDILTTHILTKRVHVYGDFQAAHKIILNIDPSQIRQALMNIVLNAIDALPSEGTLRVATENVSGIYLIKVKDSGPGIPPKTMAQIFNPFFSTKDTGSGLGLSVTKSIIENHHGRIMVESKVGVGTEFVLELPIDS